MGKYAATRVVRKDRERTSSSSSNTFSSVADYLTEVPKDDHQFALQTFLYNADPTGLYRGYIGTRDAMNYWNDYFKNTGLSWSDVKYPSMLAHIGNVGYGSLALNAANFVSKNLHRLYR